MGDRSLARDCCGDYAHDPVLARMSMLGELPLDEQLSWARATMKQLRNTREALVSSATPTVPYGDFVRDGLVALIDLRLDGLERLLKVLLSDTGASDEASPAERREMASG